MFNDTTGKCLLGNTDKWNITLRPEDATPATSFEGLSHAEAILESIGKTTGLKSEDETMKKETNLFQNTKPSKTKMIISFRLNSKQKLFF